MFSCDIEHIGKKYWITWHGAKPIALGLVPNFEVYVTAFTKIGDLVDQAVKHFELPEGDIYNLGIEVEKDVIDVASNKEFVHRVKGADKLHFVLIATGSGV